MPAKNIIATTSAPTAIGPYSQAIQFGNLLITSGQIPIDPATGDFVEGGITEQTERVLANLEAVLTAAGLGFADVVKTTVFLKNMSEFAAMNEVYAKAFPHQPPARSTVEVAGLPKGALVEIECIAAR